MGVSIRPTVGGSDSASPDSLHRNFESVLDVDPTLASDLKGSLAATDTTGKPQPKPPAGEGKLSQLWSTVKRSFSMQGLQDSAKLITDSENSASRGVLGAADQVSNTLMGGAAGLSKKTGAYKLGRTPEQQDAFLKWYDKPTSETNPLQFGEDRIRRWLGPAQGGLQGFIESASQFATGMALTGKVLPVGGMAGTLAKGSVTDMTAFDPHAKRLSNLVESGPEWIRNPATEFLQSKTSDSEAYGRLKSGLEGLVLGSTIEALTHGLRGLKALAKGDQEAAAKSFTKAGKVKPADGDVVTVEPTEDGQFAVKPKVTKEEFQRRATETLLDPALKKQDELHKGAPLDPEALKETQPLFDTLKDPNATPEAKQAAQAKIDELGAQGSKPYPEFERGNPPEEVKQRMGLSDEPSTNGNGAHPTYATQSEAESVAASVNYAAKNDLRATGSFGPDEVDSWRKAMKGYASSKDPRDVAQTLNDTGVNVNYVQSPEDVVNTIKSLVDVAPEASTVSRGKVKTWAETAKGADGMFKDMSGDEVVSHAARIFGNADKLDEHVYAMRVWMQMHANEVRKLSQMVDAAPDNGVAVDQLAKSLDTMYEFHAYLTGTSSNIARALNVHKMPVGGAMNEVAEGAAKESPEALQAEAQTVGADVDPKALAGEGEKGSGAGPNTETVADAADLVGKKGKQAAGEAPAIEDQGLNDGTKDTQGVNASDFSQSRARQKAVSALERARQVLDLPQVDEAVKADNRSLRGERVKMQADLQREDPLQAPEGDTGPSGPQNPIENLSKLLDEADRRLTQQLEAAAEKDKPKEQGQKLPEEVSPVTTRIKEVQREVRLAREELKKPTIQTASGETLTLQGASNTRSNVVTSSTLARHRAPPESPSVTAGLSRSEIRSLARTIFLTDGDPAAILSVIRGPKMRPPAELAADPEGMKKWFGFVTSYRMEAMLSGPKTQVTNATNNAIAMLQRPLEYYYAGARTGNDALKQQGADMLGGLFSGLRESWSAARKSFMSGENVLDPQNTHTGGTLQNWDDASWLSKIAHAPSRFLLSGDEFFKQMNYRANLRSQILRQARDQGITDSAQLAERLHDDMKFAFDPEGGAVNPLALQYARVGTFTNELEWGIGADIQRLVQRHPLARVIMPFVRTPVNIFRYAWERTPILNFANQDFRADWMAGGERKAIAQAKMEMGGALYATAGILATTGQITGAGPSDPELRRQWKEAGNQPYSVKIPGTNTWMSYRRLDPTFAPLGLVADMVHIHSEMAENDRDSMSAAILASIMSNVSSKTFMQGVTEFADAMSSGRGDVVGKLLKTEAGSFVPNILRQANPDQTIRETRGLLDEMMSRVPGFSTQLEPRRNLFGEKVLLPPGYANRSMNPFTFMQAPEKQDVADELVKLGRSFTMPATSKNGGLLDLTDRQKFDNGTGQSPYDYMLAQMASPEGGIPSLRQRMEQLVQSDGYKNSSEDKYINVGGEKWNIANSVIQAYQEMAWARTLQAYPKLQQGLKQSYELQGASLAGGSDAVSAVMQKYGNNTLVSPKRKPKQ